MILLRVHGLTAKHTAFQSGLLEKACMVTTTKRSLTGPHYFLILSWREHIFSGFFCCSWFLLNHLKRKMPLENSFSCPTGISIHTTAQTLHQTLIVTITLRSFVGIFLQDITSTDYILSGYKIVPFTILTLIMDNMDVTLQLFLQK